MGKSGEHRQEQQDSAGGPKKKEDAEGSSPEQQSKKQSGGGQLPPPPEMRVPPSEGVSAVDKFDQLGQTPDTDSQQGKGESLEQGKGASDASTILIMEQWLDQIEGDPALLLHNEFMLEEHRALQQRSLPLREPRPW